MAKVAIIKPPIVVPLTSIASQSGIPPIGVAYLAASLKAAGHGVQVVDAHGLALKQFGRIAGHAHIVVNGLTADQIVQRVDGDVELIAVSCMFSNEWIYAKTIIRALARRFPHVPIVAGGEHVTAEFARVLRSMPEIVACGLGEGEETLIQLTDCLTGDGAGRLADLAEIEGIAFRNAEGHCIRTASRERKRNLDEIPGPAWEEIPLANYHDAGLALGEYNRRSMPIVASRGCPYRCTFCSNPQMWEPRWYARSPRKVVDEIKSHVEKYNVDLIDFCDLTAIVNKRWTIEFCELLVQEKLKVSLALPVGTRSEALTEEVLRHLKRAGVNRIQYAPESGSPRTLKRIKKAVDLDKMRVSLRHAVKLDMTVKATLIFGFPGQTLDEVWESVRFLMELAVIGVHDVACFHFVPYPGSELYQQLNEQGVLDTRRMSERDYDLFLAANLYNMATEMKSYSEDIPDWMMPALTIGLMGTFYSAQFAMRPWRFYRVVRNLARGKPLTMFETTVQGLINNFVKGARLGLQSVDNQHEPLNLDPAPLSAPPEPVHADRVWGLRTAARTPARVHHRRRLPTAS